MKTIIALSAGHQPANNSNFIQPFPWVQDDIYYIEWLHVTTGDRRSHDYTPECVNSLQQSRGLREWLTYKACHRHWRWGSRVLAFLHLNWARSPAEAPTIDGVTFPMNAAISKTKCKVEWLFSESGQLWLHFFQMREVHPISVCVYTYSSRILEEAHLQKHLVIPTDTLLERGIFSKEDLATNETHLPSWTSAQAKCTYGDDTLRWKRT